VSATLTKEQATALAEQLDVSLDVGICHACLSFVSLALDCGDEREVAREVRRMTPDLWSDGLAEPALDAARRACTAGVPHAEEALADLRLRGGRSVAARALVLRLAAELSEEARVHRERFARVRERYGGERPDLN
jgi:hypothetical protein